MTCTVEPLNNGLVGGLGILTFIEVFGVLKCIRSELLQLKVCPA